MSLPVGTVLGSYEITGLLGAGGMGEVYRARDSKLGRDVALKVLPDLFATDPDRLARFQREAQLLASLNHPNIAQIYGLEGQVGQVGQVGTTACIVMELVEGPTLADRIARGSIPVQETLAIAKQIAEALEAAHERGVIHRDLKPANVKITGDGKVKVLDFGLAKMMDAEGAGGVRRPDLTASPTLTSPAMMTGLGMILGTAAYMSPEQAKGAPADQRSDVFSFGCVLYELLAGRQAFEGDSAAETLAAVLMREPNLDGLPATQDPRLRTLLQRCLEKSPKQRWQAIGDLRVELESIIANPKPLSLAVPSTRPWWRRLAPLAATAVLFAVAGSLATGILRSPAASGAVARFPLIVPDDVPLGRNGLVLAISPDGTRIAFVANRQLFVRELSEMTAHPIAGTASLNVEAPIFSPDGRWLAFHAMSDSTLKKISVNGGPALTLCKVDAGSVVGLSWQSDALIFPQRGRGIVRVSANAGEPELLVPVDPSDVPASPQLIDRNTVLFTVSKPSVGISAPTLAQWDAAAKVVVQRIGSTDRRVVVQQGTDGLYVPTGHLIYALGGTLLAVPFDMGTLRTHGSPVPVVDGVSRTAGNGGAIGKVQFAVSPAGSLLYLSGTAAGVDDLRILALADRTGKIEPLGLPPQPLSHPRVSPDGKQIVFATDDGRDAVVWVYDLAGTGPARRLTFTGRNVAPIWSGGGFITYESNREGDLALFRQPASASGATPERLTKPSEGVEQRPEAVTPDGKTLAFVAGSTGLGDIFTMALAGDRTPKAVVAAPTNDRYSAFSPDGRWLAYASGPAVNFDVFVQPFPPTGETFQVSTGGGRDPLWTPDGRQLLYNTANTSGVGNLVAVDVNTEPAIRFGQPTPIPIRSAILGGLGRNYDITPDGKRFLIVTAPPNESSAGRTIQQINVVLNWFDELKTKVPR